MRDSGERRVILPIDDCTRIVGTYECWQIEKLYTPGELAKSKEPKWVPKKWFMTLRQALSAACEAEIRAHPAIGIASAQKAAENIRQRYAELLESVK